MTALINKFRIPTLLGLTILTLGIVAGVYLVVRDQSFVTKASPNLAPQNLTLTNIDDSSITISWQTTVQTPAFITYGQTISDQTALDDRDKNAPVSRTIHHITIKNLLPKSSYQYKIISGKYSSETLKFTTAAPASTQNGFGPVIGSALDSDKPLSDGIVYLAVNGAVTQSSVVKQGNFVIPLSTARKSDLLDNFTPEEGVIGKITIISEKGEASALFKLQATAKPLPPIRLGQNLDFTSIELQPKAATPSTQNITKYDLNSDGLVNTADYAIVLRNFGKKGTSIKGDLNSDGVVDQKDLELMSKQLIHE